MFSHVMIGAADLEQSRQFYDAVLGTLGIAPGAANKHRYFYRGGGGTFSISTNGGRWNSTALMTAHAVLRLSSSHGAERL